MKKGKNIVLLLGIIFMLVQLLINVVRTNFRTISGFNLVLLGISVLYYFAILIFPILTLRLDLKNKSNRKMAIISVIVCSLCLLIDVLSIIRSIMALSRLGVAPIAIIMTYIRRNILAVIAGYALLIAGSVLSLRKEELTTRKNL